MRILGISAFYHDSAAALVEDGAIVAAAQEERFTRKKHDSGFPASAIAYCLAESGVKLDDVDFVVFYEKPFIKFERLLETYLAFAPRGFSSFSMAIPIWVKEKLFQKRLLIKELREFESTFDQTRLLFAEHHQSHAASAFFPSPFEEAAILTLDGVGEWGTTTMGRGFGNQIEITKEIRFPHSLGLLYSAFTYYTGFKVNSGEYKVMGLAPFGEPRFAQTIVDNLIDLKEDGSFWLDQSYFNYSSGLTMTNRRFDDLFGGPPRTPDEEIQQTHMDLAASIQDVTNEVVVRLARSIAKESGSRNLCLAGGVALNCVSNAKVLGDGCFDQIWIQPAAGDGGGAVGAALAAYHEHAGRPRQVASGIDGMRGSLLGPAFGQEETEARLAALGARFRVLSEDELVDAVVDHLVDEAAIGWFQGRMEFGPRALGARSIIGDARSGSMQQMLNLKIKYRESFRPFAPSVLSEFAADYFDIDRASPYMLLVADVKEERRREMTDAEESLFGIEKLNVPRSDIPAVTHVDYSARLQTVHRETNPKYHKLIDRFRQRTGCAVIVNTSFNVRGEPIVCTPEDAFRCFMGTEMDVLAIGNCLLLKREQDPSLAEDYKHHFELD